MSIDPQIKFSQIRKGYNPQEVDAVFEEMQRVVNELREEKQALTQTIGQYDSKLRQLVQSTQRLEQDRVKESLRLTGLMNSAAQMAEQTEQSAKQNAVVIFEQARSEAAELLEKARQEADGITKQAYIDCAAARDMLARLEANMQSFRQRLDRYVTESKMELAELEGVLERALRDDQTVGAPDLYKTLQLQYPPMAEPSDPAVAVPIIPMSSAVPVSPIPQVAPTAPVTSTPPSSPVSSMTPPSSVSEEVPIPTPGFDPYAEFVKNMETDGRPPDPPTLPKRDSFIGHFGD